MVKFCIDKIVDNEYYPNLAKDGFKPFTNEWQTFSTLTPFSEPFMLLKHLKHHNINFKVVDIKNADKDTFYPIALSFFDFSINWFELMPTELINKLKAKQIKLLFYYSEGDNPQIIDKHLSEQCVKNKIPREQVKFISANSKAKDIDNFYFIVDDELLYYYRNRKHAPAFYTEEERDKKFTALVRMHKFWRANTMATLWQKCLDTDGYFGYGNEINSNEHENDNPIEVDRYMGLRQLTRTFMNVLPFKADTLNSDDHNNHTMQVREHYENSYINIILESHMDVDQSNGVFLTEKTFKPIKNSQLFILFGPHGSLQLLRDLGYKTFDHVLDNSYDTIPNTTERWKKVMNLTTTILERPKYQIHDMYIKCQEDIIHNQDLFNSYKTKRLKNIIKEITNND